MQPPAPPAAPPAPAPAALAGRKRRHGSGPVEGVGGGEMSPRPGTSSQDYEGDMTYSQERLHLRITRLHAEEEVTRSAETDNRQVELRVLEEELLLKFQTNQLRGKRPQ